MAKVCTKTSIFKNLEFMNLYKLHKLQDKLVPIYNEIIKEGEKNEIG